jgi:predicted nucleotidyltransferase
MGVSLKILGQILSSNVRAEVFRHLFGVEGQELHLRELERRSGFAIGTVRREVLKLLRLELIKERRDGNRVYFKANNEHPLYSDIRNIVLKTSGFLGVIGNVLQGEEIAYAFIFGSIASGKQKFESDIDLFVVGDLGLRRLCKLLRSVSDQLGREINSTIMTKEEFSKRLRQKEHFVANIMESPKLMIIGKEDELARLG